MRWGLTTRRDRGPRWLVLIICTWFCLGGSLAAQGQSALYFAQLVHGGTSAPYQTTLQLFNPTNQDLTATISIFKDDGSPFAVGLRDGQSGVAVNPTSPGVFSLTVPAHGIKVLSTSGSQALQSGWVQVTSASSSLTGNVFFQQMDASGNILGQAAVPQSSLTSAFSGILEKSATVNTGIAFANPSASSTANLKVQITDAGGSRGLSTNITLQPLQHLARFVNELPNFDSLGNVLGTIAVSSDNSIAVTFLRLDRGQLTTLPVFSGTGLSPTISAIFPTQGSAETTVTISGSNFNPTGPGSNQVTFNGVNANIISVTSSTIVATVPPGLPITNVPVVVTANGSSSNAITFGVVGGFPAPVIISLTPSSVLSGFGTTTVTINGKNFATRQEGAVVRFGSNQLPGGSLQVVNSTQATITLTPDLLTTAGTFPVIYVNPGGFTGGTPSNSVDFQVVNQATSQPPVINSISPTSGRVSQQVTITGSNFDPINPANDIVKFSGVTATSIVSVSVTQIVVSVPAGATSGPVTVTSNGLTSNAVNFTVVAPPPLRLVNSVFSPARVIYDPQKDQAVVTNFLDSGTVTFINVSNAVVTKTVSTGGSDASGIAQFGRLAVVANKNNPIFDPNRIVTVFNLDSQAVQNTYLLASNVLSASPFNVAIDTINGNALVTDNNLKVGEISVATGNGSFFSMSTPFDVAVYHPTNSPIDWAVVTDNSNNLLNVFDLQAQTFIASIPVGQGPQGVAVNQNTGVAVVVNFIDRTATIVDLVNRTVRGTVPVGSRPVYVAVDSSRNRAIVANGGDGTLSVIDLSSKTVIATVSTGGTAPLGLAINETADLAIVANSGSDNVSIIALP